MTDEEKAEEYAQSEINKMFVDESEEVYVRASTLKQIIKNSHLKGLAEGRNLGKEEQWHDLRKDPTDLPKCAENEQVIFYVQEYYKEIGKCKNHYCLGFYKKSFMDDDVKVFVERSKGYECEHSTEDVLFWWELPKFEQKSFLKWSKV